MKFLIVALLVIILCDATEVERHVSRVQSMNLLSLHSNTEDFIDSTFVLYYNGSVQDRHMDVLVETLERDNCILLYSAKGYCLYKVYCHHRDDMSDAMLILNYTIHDYFYRFFGTVNIQCEQNKPLRRPHFFYGNEHTLEYAARLDARIEQTMPTILMPSRGAMDRIKAENYIAVNAGWDLDRIDQRAGMLDQRYQYIVNTPEIDIYVIDTGIRVTHSEFEGRATFLINTVDDGINTDMAGHGTFCASEVAGKTFGVARKAKLYAVKVLDSLGDGDLFTIQAGILQVIETSKLNMFRRAVASLSLGGTKSPLLENAVASLTANNIVTVVSAGNSGADACQYSPSSLGGVPGANVISVGASDINDYRPTWSNYGSCVSISAPGTTITAAWITSDTSTHSLSGTSMAAPLVAGVAALVLQQDKTLTVAAVKKIILAWATPNIIDYASVTGGGQNLLYSLIDLKVAIPQPTPPPPALIVTIPTDGRNNAYQANSIKLCLLLSTMAAILLF